MENTITTIADYKRFIKESRNKINNGLITSTFLLKIEEECIKDWEQAIFDLELKENND